MGKYARDYVTYSDDSGASWRTVEGTPFEGMDEATMADLGGGHVLANFRHERERTLGRGVARSKDAGITWTNVTFGAQLPGPRCQASLVQQPRRKKKKKDPYLPKRRAARKSHTRAESRVSLDTRRLS